MTHLPDPKHPQNASSSPHPTYLTPTQKHREGGYENHIIRGPLSIQFKENRCLI